MFRLPRYFSITSGIAVIVVSITLAGLYRQSEIARLTKLIESQNIGLAHAFANILWSKYGEYVNSVSALDGDALRARRETREIHATLKVLTDGLPVLKVKMYSLDGLTVYSSEFSQIGASKKGDVGFEATILKGTPSTKSSFRETFQSFDGLVTNRHLIESYLPIHGPNGRVEGIFELYADVTPLVAQIGQTTTRVAIYLLLSLALLYALPYLIVRHADQVMARQYLDLEREIAGRQSAEYKYKAAKELAEAATLAKSEFLANMSHELRTPLNAIIGFSAMIQEQTFGPVGNVKYVEYVSDINDAGHHLLELINDILDLSKIEVGRLDLHDEVLDISAIIQSCARFVAERASTIGSHLDLALTDDIPPLTADRRMLKQILLSLLSNAIKFTPAGGRICVRPRFDADRGHVIQVADTGIGMAREDIATAMETFGQVDSALNRKYDGSGLGLPLSKTLVELHGGSLSLDSDVGVGTTVTIRFPLERSRPLPTSAIIAAN